METHKTAAELKIVYRQLVKQVHIEDISQFKVSNIKKIGKRFPGLENSKFSIQFIDDDNQKVEIKTDKDLIHAFVIASSRSFLRVMLVPIEKSLLEQVENDSDNGSDFELVDKSSSESEEDGDDDDDDDISSTDEKEIEVKEKDNTNISSLSISSPPLFSSNENKENDEVVEEQDKELLDAIAASLDEESKLQDLVDIERVPDVVVQVVQPEVIVESPKVENDVEEIALNQLLLSTEPSSSSLPPLNEEDEVKADMSSQPPSSVTQVAEDAMKSAAPHEAAALHKALKAVIEEYSIKASLKNEENTSLPKLREALSLVLSNPNIVAEIQQAIGTEQVKKFVVDVFAAEKEGKDIWAAAAVHLVPMLEIISKVMQTHPQLFALVPIVVVFLMDIIKEKPTTSNIDEIPSKNNRQRSQIIHKRVICDGCKKNNPNHNEYINGVRYKSAMVEDFDLCEDCEENGAYNESHGPFLKIYTPAQAPESILCILKDDERNRTSNFGQFAADITKTVPTPAGTNIFIDADGKDAENLFERISSIHANATAQASASIPIATCSSNNQSCCSFSPAAVAQSIQAATISKQLKCPQHHLLNRFEIPNFGFRCDICSTRPNAGEIMFGCRTCDFDLCSSCADRLDGPEIRLMKFQCSGKHILKRHLASHPNYTCDNCFFKPGLNGALYGCRLCNFDLCVNCYDEATRRRLTTAVEPLHVQPVFPLNISRPQAKFVQDITFKDGSIVSPGQTFVKIWRIKNPAKTAWPEGCRLAVVGGERFNAPLSGISIRPLAPEETAEISAILVAPAHPGRAIGYFRLLTADNQRFGNRIWVDITVDGTLGEAIAATLVRPLRNISEKIVSKVQEYQINNSSTSTPAAVKPYPVIGAVVPSHPPVTASSLSQISENDIAFGQIVQTQNEDEKMRKYSLEIQSLIDMGFTNIEQNIALLEKHNGNLEEVIASLFQQ